MVETSCTNRPWNKVSLYIAIIIFKLVVQLRDLVNPGTYIRSVKKLGMYKTYMRLKCLLKWMMSYSLVIMVEPLRI